MCRCRTLYTKRLRLGFNHNNHHKQTGQNFKIATHHTIYGFKYITNLLPTTAQVAPLTVSSKLCSVIAPFCKKHHHFESLKRKPQAVRQIFTATALRMYVPCQANRCVHTSISK
eukprot:8886483-Pyramimonas_sp.AAC.1